MSGDDRRTILARRQRFLSAALCGATAGMLVASCDQSGPVCHSARRTLPRTLAESIGCAPPVVCLTVEMARDAGATPVVVDASDDAAGE
jgi:hypothetical protein